MKHLAGCKFALAAGAAGLLTAFSASAALTELQIRFDEDYSGRVYGGGAPANGQKVWLTALSAEQIGGDPLPVPTKDPFITFCLDIASSLITTAWWESGTFASAGTGNEVSYVSGGIQRAASLYNAYAGSVDISTTSGKKEGAALQLAIWNVLYDTDTTVLTGNGFRVTGANKGVTQLANEMLLSPYNVANPSLTSTFWNATDCQGNPICNQDLLGPQLPSGFVPEPGVYAVAASACAALYLIGLPKRRRRG